MVGKESVWTTCRNANGLGHVRKSDKGGYLMRRLNEIPTVEYLEECFHLDEENGILTWKSRPLSHFKDEAQMKRVNSRMAGKQAGNLCDGKVRVEINGIPISATRLIWKMMKKNDPNFLLFHRDSIASNNKISNLTELVL
jgi:hypothetical protein